MNPTATDTPVTEGMVWIAGGRFRMGSDRHYPEERPSRMAACAGFWIDPTPVTNAEFDRFVRATGHVTLAETAPTLEEYPDADPTLLRPGSAVFHRTRGPVDLHDHSRWWSFDFDACWRDPRGDGAGIGGAIDHPVVHIAYGDALAFAEWAGKAIPTEVEWEFAARGGLEGAAFAWGDELAPDGRMLANYWQGEFPWQNLETDGFAGTSPVRSFPANGHDLYDMIGNVWEWTVDPFTATSRATSPCCSSAARAIAGSVDAPRVIKGGSHLCAANYCQRYRPAARHSQAIDTSTTHIGFRCVLRP